MQARKCFAESINIGESSMVKKKKAIGYSRNDWQW